MTRDTFLGYLRSAMAIIGSLLIGKDIFGTPVTTEILDGVIGGGLFVASVIWGIADKTATEEQVSSAIFKVFTLVGGILLAKGIISSITLTAILGLVPLLAAEIVKRVIHGKDEKVATGQLGLLDTKGAQTAMKKGENINPVKTIAILFALSIACSCSHGQSFFKALPKKQAAHGFSVSPTGQTTMNAIRPVVNVASYSVPGNRLMTGAGISYQHLSWDEPNQKWRSEWTVNALAWYFVPLNDEDQTNGKVAYGVSFGFFNNLIMVGGATDGKYGMATVGIGINLNN